MCFLSNNPYILHRCTCLYAGIVNEELNIKSMYRIYTSYRYNYISVLEL